MSPSAKKTWDAVSEEAHGVAEVAREKIGDVRDKVGEYYEEGLAAARRWEEDLERGVRQHPVRALLIAAGIAGAAGLLIGAMIRR